MNYIEANNTTYSIGEHNDTGDCEWRILADYAGKQWRYDQEPAADNGGEWCECCPPGFASGQTRMEHKQQDNGCDHHKYDVQHNLLRF
jgi:hypothetical protein